MFGKSKRFEIYVEGGLNGKTIVKTVPVLADYSDDAMIAIYNCLDSIMISADNGMDINNLLSDSKALTEFIREKSYMFSYTFEYFQNDNPNDIWPELWQDMIMEYIPYVINEKKYIDNIYSVDLYKINTAGECFLYEDDEWKKVLKFV